MKRKNLILSIILIVLMFAFASGTPKEMPESKSNVAQTTENKGDEMSFEISSSGFSNGEKIPVKFTCEGQNISPALSWKNPPSGTAEFALICDDPDAPAGVWSHWLLYNIPPETNSIAEGERNLQGTQGVTDFGRARYDGPCPPRGKPHRYFFTIYALDKKLGLPKDLDRASLLKSVEGHILAKAQVIGIFSR